MQNSAICQYISRGYYCNRWTSYIRRYFRSIFELKQKYGGHELISLTIHKDEGYFTKNNQNFIHTKHIKKKKITTGI